MSDAKYTLSQASAIRFSLINEFETLLHVAALDLEGDDVADAILGFVPEISGSGSSHDTSRLIPLATELVDRILACPEDMILEPGPDMFWSE